MQFSLRTLFAVVLIAAIFTATLLYTTDGLFAVLLLLALGILSVGTTSILFGGLPRRFWIPFCIVGWLYLAVAFTPLASNRLTLYLPSTQLSYWIWSKTPLRPFGLPSIGNELSVRNGELSIELGSTSPNVGPRGWVYLRCYGGFTGLLRIMHLISAVLLGSLAGVVAFFILPHKSEPRSE
jgi:hypothetical protein